MSNISVEPEEPITAVHIDGLAVLQIIKHCQESLPQLVTGSLLGLTVSHGILEITRAFPFPEPRDANKDADAVILKSPDGTTAAGSTFDAQQLTDEGAALEGHEFQLEMMKMLREVNVDNNCVGWYQSSYLGSYSTSSLLENQLSYQTELSPNAVVLLYDPTQSAHGSLMLKCFRLSPEVVSMKMENKNTFLDPKRIFQEIPIQFKNPGLVQALLQNISDGSYPHSTTSSSTLASTLMNASSTTTDTATAANRTAVMTATIPTASQTTNTSSLNDYYYDALFSPSSSTALLLQYPKLFESSIQHSASSYHYSTSAADTTFDRLDLSTNPYLEKHLEFLCSWVDDLAMEQNKFQSYARTLARGGFIDSANNPNAAGMSGKGGRYDKKKGSRQDGAIVGSGAEAMTLQDAWGTQDAPKRLESLLMTNQIRNYCDQVDKYAGSGFGKLFLAGGLHTDEVTSSSRIY